MTRQQAVTGAKHIALWLGIVGVVLGAGRWIQHTETANAWDAAYRDTTRVKLQRLDSMALDVRDIYTLTCKQYPEDSACDRVRRR